MAKMIKNIYTGLMGLTMRDALKYAHYAWAVFMTVMAIGSWIDSGYIEISVEYWYELAMVYFWFTGVSRLFRRFKAFAAARINTSIERKANRKTVRA